MFNIRIMNRFDEFKLILLRKVEARQDRMRMKGYRAVRLQNQIEKIDE
jgi:hypothetical protein